MIYPYYFLNILLIKKPAAPNSLFNLYLHDLLTTELNGSWSIDWTAF